MNATLISPANEAIQIENVSAANIELLADLIAMSNLSGFDGNEGLLSGNELQIRYQYSPQTEVLTFQLVRLPEHLSTLLPQVVSTSLKQLIQSVGVLGIEPPTKTAIYNIVSPSLTNNSGAAVTFTQSDISEGTIHKVTHTIPNGSDGESLFEAESTVFSGLGTQGTMSYTFADETELNIEWKLNTRLNRFFNVGLGGRNSSSYSISITNNQAYFKGGTTYLKPDISLTKR